MWGRTRRKSGGFERYGWGPPLLDDEASTFISQTFQRADAFLLGRRTYEVFAGSWGEGMDPGNPVGEALNNAAQVRRLDHAQGRSSGQARPSCPVTSRPPSAS